MKLITRDTDYAIRAICFMVESHDKERINVSDLVKGLNVPRPFLRKILQVLTKKGMLVSYKGKGGGFQLVQDSNKIFLVDLIKIFQGDFKLNECVFVKGMCQDARTCVLRTKIGEIERSVVSRLKSITIASLVKEGRGK